MATSGMGMPGTPITMELVLAVTLGTASICRSCHGYGGWVIERTMRLDGPEVIAAGAANHQTVTTEERRVVCQHCDGCGISTP